MNKHKECQKGEGLNSSSHHTEIAIFISLVWIIQLCFMKNGVGFLCSTNSISKAVLLLDAQHCA